MKVLSYKKNYLAKVSFYIFLILWHTSKLALAQTYRYAPRLIRVPRYQTLGKPWKKMKEAATKVIRNRKSLWKLEQSHYKKLSTICWKCLNIPGWKHLYRYSQILAAWDKRLLIKIRDNFSKHGRKRLGSSAIQNRKQINDYCYKTALRQPSYAHIFNDWHNNTKLKLYKRMPLRMLSRFWGQLNNLDLPYWLRRPTFYLYVWMFNCRPDEVIVQDFSRYKNLSEFFRRLLKPGLRPIDKAMLTSPVDGRVLHCGRVQNGTLEQVKGVTYSLSGFLGPLNFNVVNHSNFEKLNYFGQMRKKSGRPDSSVNESDAFINGQLTEGKQKSDVIDADDVVVNNIDDEGRKAKVNSSNDENGIKSVSKSDDKHLSQYNFDINNINNNKTGINSTPFKSSNMNKAPPLLCDPTMNGLFYCVIYLAPGDYHRFHSPADWFVQMRRHFPGELFSVKPSVAHWLKGLFNMNERVVYFGRWAHGFFSMSPVGATNVGSICVYIDKSLKTNVYRNNKLLIHYDKSFINNKNNNDDDKNNNSTSGKNDSNVNNTIDVKSIDPRLSQIHQKPQSHQPQPHQPQPHQPQQQKQQPQGIYLKKGKLFGEFNLGSTIVLLFEAPNNFKFAVVPGQKIQYGQAISDE